MYGTNNTENSEVHQFNELEYHFDIKSNKLQ